jgi:hypothetical protein
MRILIAVLIVLAGCIPGPSRARGDGAESPQAEAIRLVIAQRGDEIRSLDDPEAWWFDTKERSWSARRPFGPGTLDSRHYFQVSFAIDGQVVRTWSVNTRTRQVGSPDEPVGIE